MATSAAKGAAANPALGLSPLSSPGAIYAAAKALTDAQTQGPLNQLANQIAQNNRQTAGATKLTGGYFNSLGQYVNQGNQQIGQIGSNLNDTLARIGGETQAQLQGLGANAQASLQKYSPSADAAGAPNSLTSAGVAQLANEIARQGSLAAQNSQTERAFGAIQGANYSSLGASHLQTYAQAGQEALKGIAQAGQLRNQPLETQRAGLISNRGALLSANEYKIRQQEISNQATNAALGIKQQAIVSAAKTATANRNAAGKRNAASIQGRKDLAVYTQGEQDKRNTANIDARTKTQRNAAAKAVGKPPLYTATGQRVLSGQQQQGVFKNIDSIYQKGGLIDQMRQPLNAALAKYYGKPVGSVLDNATIIRQLGSTHNPASKAFTPAEIDAAMALKGWNYLTPRQIIGLNRMGVIVGTKYGRRAAPPKPKTGVLGGNLFGIPV